MSNLLEQWNEHIIRGNQLSRELEDIEDIIEKSKGADICFSSGANGAVFIRVLSPEKMQELRENVVIAIIRTRDDKAAELEKLMGVRKPATINPVFEAAVKEMFKSKDKPVVINPAMDEPELPPLTKTPQTLQGKKILDKGAVHEDKVFSVETAPAKPEMNVTDVRRMYQDENKSMAQIAEFFGGN